jgi:hypothetical protein
MTTKTIEVSITRISDQILSEAMGGINMSLSKSFDNMASLTDYIENTLGLENVVSIEFKR